MTLWTETNRSAKRKLPHAQSGKLDTIVGLMDVDDACIMDEGNLARELLHHPAVPSPIAQDHSNAVDLSTATVMESFRPLHRILVQKLVNWLPEGPSTSLAVSISHPVPSESSPTPIPSVETILPQERQTIQTAANEFGLYREYHGFPEKVPDENLDVNDLTEGVRSNSDSYTSSASLEPFPNRTTLNFLHWFWNCGSLKSVADHDHLVKEVLHAPDGFNPQDLNVAQLHKLDAQMSGWNIEDSNLFPSTDGWIESTVQILVPDGSPHNGGEGEVPKFSVPHFYHRNLTEVIKAAFKAPAAERFHFTPHKQFWQPPNNPESPPQRVVNEMYNADAFLAADEEVQHLPLEPNCQLPCAVAGLMFASDGVQLTTFGDASLWPGYAYIANQSKWERTKPRARAAHHIAYFPKVFTIVNIDWSLL